MFALRPEPTEPSHPSAHGAARECHSQHKMVDGMLAIPACFIGAGTTLKEADELVNEISAIGHEVARMDE